jgi:hypothetical protein
MVKYDELNQGKGIYYAFDLVFKHGKISGEREIISKHM